MSGRTLLLLAALSAPAAMCAADQDYAPFAQEVRILSHERQPARPRRLPGEGSVTRRPPYQERRLAIPKTFAAETQERRGPVMPPLVEFIQQENTAPPGAADESPILRSFPAHLDMPAPYPEFNLNMRLPTPF